jgi:hypothetical protein
MFHVNDPYSTLHDTLLRQGPSAADPVALRPFLSSTSTICTNYTALYVCQLPAYSSILIDNGPAAYKDRSPRMGTTYTG